MEKEERKSENGDTRRKSVKEKKEEKERKREGKRKKGTSF